MADHNLSQLIGALGAWIESRRDQIPDGDLSAATRLILGGHLIGIALSDTDAPELDRLNAVETRVVERARGWALAQPESVGSRDPADDPGRRLDAMMRASAEARKTVAQPDGVQPQPTAPSRQAGGIPQVEPVTPSRLAVQKAVEKAHREILAERANAARRPAGRTLGEPVVPAKRSVSAPTRVERLPVAREQPPATPTGDESIPKQDPVTNGPTGDATPVTGQRRDQPGSIAAPDRARSRRTAVVRQPAQAIVVHDWLATPTTESGEATGRRAPGPQTASPANQPGIAMAPSPPAVSLHADVVPKRAFSGAASSDDASPPRPTIAARAGRAESPSRSARLSWRRFEEYFWWGLCVLAIVILAWRRLL